MIDIIIDEERLGIQIGVWHWTCVWDLKLRDNLIKGGSDQTVCSGVE
jgi:hypothetical protein